MKNFEYAPQGVCSKAMFFGIDDNKIHGLRVVGGCNGNLQGIGKLVEGMDIDFVIEKFAGTRCGNRPTSCPDQRSVALREAYAASGAKA